MQLCECAGCFLQHRKETDMPDKPVVNDQIKLVRVRLSFPDLFTPKKVERKGNEKEQEPKYGAVFLLDKSDDEQQIKQIRGKIWELAKAQWGDKAAALIKKGTVRVCLHEGAEKEYDGYGENVMYVSTSTKRRPAVVDRDRSPLTDDDNKIYAGCYVNAVIRFWVQDNQYGKRVNAQLQGVQFVADGEAFGAAPFNPEEHFEELEPKREAGEGGGEGGGGEGGPGPDDDDEIPF
jgi:hypothetical protein